LKEEPEDEEKEERQESPEKKKPNRDQRRRSMTYLGKKSSKSKRSNGKQRYEFVPIIYPRESPGRQLGNGQAIGE
jgi:hypothetical protein